MAQIVDLVLVNSCLLGTVAVALAHVRYRGVSIFTSFFINARVAIMYRHAVIRFVVRQRIIASLPY